MWIARNENDSLHLFKLKPYKIKALDKFNGGSWESPDIENEMEIDPSLFSYLKPEDDPIEVELVIKNLNKKGTWIGYHNANCNN